MFGGSVLAWAIAGVLGGWTGRAVVKRRGLGGIAADLLIGALGGITGGLVFTWFGHLRISNVNVGGVAVAFIAAIVLVLLSRLISVKKTA